MSKKKHNQSRKPLSSTAGRQGSKALVGRAGSGKRLRDKERSPLRSPAKKGAGRPPWWLILAGIMLLAVIVVLVVVGLRQNRGTAEPGSVESGATPVATAAAEVTGVAPRQPAEAGQAQVDGVMPEDPTARNGMYTAPPPLVIDPEKVYIATFETEHGEVVIELFADRVPNTVNNFVFLAREGFYDGTTFHRVLQDFMAQAGDPTGTGGGGPGYTFADEFHPDLRHDVPGRLSMANSGPGTNGSQFFITFAPTPWLNGGHTVFGQVVEGFEVLEQVKLRDPQNPADLETPGDSLIAVRVEERDEGILPPPAPVPTIEAGQVPMPGTPASRDQIYAGRPAMVIDPAKQYEAVFELASGNVVVELFADKVPALVNSFVFLAREGFYDDTIFFYVVPDQAVLAGDPTGSGMGGPGYYLPAEFHPDLRHDVPGTMSLVNLGLNDVSSQFLFTLIEFPILDGQYSVIGRVTEGLELLEELEGRDPSTAAALEDGIKTVTIQEK
jgi:cyclophilin family peptidyl-prolyl cis-trans isomerase